MGADLLLEFVKAPRVSRLVALERVPLFVAAMDRDELLTGVGYLTGDKPEPEIAAGVLAALLASAVGVMYEERRRDVACWVDSAGAEWFVTGGMSWGDDPTDAFNPFSVLAFTGFDAVLADPDWTPSKES